MTLSLMWPKPLVSTRYLAFLLGVPLETLRAIAEESQSLYAPFTKKQQRNGRTKERRIDNPTERLKSVQRRIKERLFDQVVLPEALVGGVPRRSTKDNAKPHVRRPVVVTMDFESFFPRINNHQVADMWRDRFGASREVSWLLTRLTTFDGHLPQGSPASNGVANLVLLPFTGEATALCEARGCRVTVYVDDITVSGRCPEGIIDEIARLASRHGFRIARRKTQVMREHDQQRVTGHIVNRKISSGRTRVRDVRRRLLDIVNGRADPADLPSLRGLVAHIGATCAKQGKGLRRLMDAAVNQTGTAQLGVQREVALNDGHP